MTALLQLDVDVVCDMCHGTPWSHVDSNSMQLFLTAPLPHSVLHPSQDRKYTKIQCIES
jgi:hypothetical protein